jgi:hypothetical protein
MTDILFEFTQIGQTVKVTAINPATGLEASIVGDPAAGQHALEQLALRKLRYVSQKRSEEQ